MDNPLIEDTETLSAWAQPTSSIPVTIEATTENALVLRHLDSGDCRTLSWELLEAIGQTSEGWKRIELEATRQYFGTTPTV